MGCGEDRGLDRLIKRILKEEVLTNIWENKVFMKMDPGRMYQSRTDFVFLS